MKTFHLCLIALALVACEGKSKKGGSPIQQDPNGTYVPGEGSWNSPAQNNNSGCTVSQNDGCHHSGDQDQAITVTSTRSWRYTDASSTISSAESCLQGFSAQGNQFVMIPSNMGLRLASDRRTLAARCLVHAQVSYPRGWSFALRQVDVNVHSSIRGNAVGSFEGAYQIQGQSVLGLNETFSTYGDHNKVVHRQFGDSDLAWSSCDGQATLALNTVLKLQPTSGSSYGTPSSLGNIAIDSNYRFEIVWAKCR